MGDEEEAERNLLIEGNGLSRQYEYFRRQGARLHNGDGHHSSSENAFGAYGLSSSSPNQEERERDENDDSSHDF